MVFAGIKIGKPVVVSAEDSIINKGYISAGVTQVRVRTSIDTSSTANVIVEVNAGFRFDIYGSEYATNGYEWYSVGFTYEGLSRRGYVAAEFVTIDNSGGGSDYTEDTDFEAYLTAQGFPESYKDGLRTLHAQYPKWVFKAEHITVDWNTMVREQNSIGKSLIYDSAPDSWKSTDSSCYDWSTGRYIEWDTGGWVQANTELIQYALDPRNFFDDTRIFMFEKLSYDTNVQNESGVKSIIQGTFMENSSHSLSYNNQSYTYSSALMLAGEISMVSPYHLATRIIQEQGPSGQSQSISGTVNGFTNIYNYYNQGAYASGNTDAVTNGLKYASKDNTFSLRPWNTRMKSIIGGAKNIGDGYINVGQDTLYYEKFDVIRFSNQYMTNILAPRSESYTESKAYTESMRQSVPLIFIIPVYKGMPDTACEIPEEDYRNINNKLSDLSVNGYNITPSFDIYTNDYDLIVDNEVSNISVSGTLVDTAKASVSGLGSHNLDVGDNTINIDVTAQNGDVNTYRIHVVRKGATITEVTDGVTTKFTINKDKGLISNIGPERSASNVLENCSFSNGKYGKVYDIDGNEVRDIVKTGDIFVVFNSSNQIELKYTIIVYGDINGDGKIDVFDLIYMRRHLLDISQLSGAYAEAADTSRGNDGIDVYDLIYLRRQLLDIAYITQ